MKMADDPFQVARRGRPLGFYDAQPQDQPHASLPATGSMGRMGQTAAPAPPLPFPDASQAQLQAQILQHPEQVQAMQAMQLAGVSSSSMATAVGLGAQLLMQQTAPSGSGVSSGLTSSSSSSSAPGLGFSPEFVETTMQGPLAQAGLSIGRQFVQSNISRYAPGASVLWQSLRYHFDVNNAYVLAKLRRVLFPFLAPNWRRATAREAPPEAAGRHTVPDAASGDPFVAPAFDVNAPDLYIPAMAFITFVLASGLLKGTRAQFHPEVLVSVASSALLAQALEVGVLKAALASLSADVGVLDLASYTSYKYVGLTINTLAGLLLGAGPFYAALAYTGAAMAFAFVNSLVAVAVHAEPRPIAPGMQPAPPLLPALKSGRTNLIVVAGLLQVVLMWLLSSY